MRSLHCFGLANFLPRDWKKRDPGNDVVVWTVYQYLDSFMGLVGLVWWVKGDHKWIDSGSHQRLYSLTYDLNLQLTYNSIYHFTNIDICISN